MMDMVTLRQCIQTNLAKEWADISPSDDCFDKNEENMGQMIDFIKYINGHPFSLDQNAHTIVRSHLVQCVRCRYVYGVVRGYVI